MSVVLLGYRGCGKTTIGRKLADRLWLKFVDTDELVTAGAGKTIREIFESEGEEKFREREVAAVQEACGRADHVVALGGGAILREENRALLKSLPAARAYLRCDAKELLKRIEADPATAANRPALTKLSGSLEEIRQQLALREPYYRELMTTELEVTNLSPEEAVVYLSRLI